MSRDQIKKYVVVAMKISIGIFVIWYLLKSGYLTKLFNIRNINFIIIAALAFLCCQLLCAVRLAYLLTTINLSLRFSYVFKLTMIGNFFNIAIPGAAGGDIVKGFYLIKDEENNKARSSGIIVITRVLGVLSIMFLGGASIVYLLFQKNTSLSAYLYCTPLSKHVYFREFTPNLHGVA